MRYILLFILTLFFSDILAQTKVAVKKNTKGDQPFYIINSSDLFYIGVENRFILYKDPTKKYSFKVQNGVIAKEDVSSKDSSIYYIDVKNTNPTFVNITVDGRTYSYKFRNRKIPSPVLKIYMGSSLNESKGGDVKASDFSKAESVILDLSDFDYAGGFSKIINMEVTKVSNDETKSYMLTDNKIAEITKYCAPGEIYIFSKVVIEFTDSKNQRSINGTTFFIK
ncbi:MAG: hypothetical protein IPI93_04460 [Sphingobacteriaceae bacterium]|nr:hypothetical protein [Sphingobacteriaceae bacterium]